MELNNLYRQFQPDLHRCAAEPEESPRITVIGGGTGLSTLLRGLKFYSHNLTAVVSVADNGGSSGLLRKDLGILPPGDIRNCILALADTEPLMDELMNYRFSGGSLDGQNFGNLFLAALSAICDDNFYEAVRNFANVLAVTGLVLPVSLTDLNISAVLDNGEVIHGESAIGSRTNMTAAAIEKIYMDPPDATPLYESVRAIKQADLVVLGPGSLYTSIIPNLLFREVVEAIEETEGKVAYVCNLMTQPAETYDYTAMDHLQAILNHSGHATCQDFIDFCIVNNAPIPASSLENYLEQDSVTVSCNPDAILQSGADLIQTPLVSRSAGEVRHDAVALAEVLTMLACLARDEKIEQADTRVYRG